MDIDSPSSRSRDEIVAACTWLRLTETINAVQQEAGRSLIIIKWIYCRTTATEPEIELLLPLDETLRNRAKDQVISVGPIALSALMHY